MLALILAFVAFASAGSSCEDSAEQIYKAFASGNLTGLFETLDNSVVWTTFGSPTTITSRTYNAPAGVKQYFEDDAVVFTTTQFSPDPQSNWVVGVSDVGVEGIECGHYTFHDSIQYCNRWFHRWHCNSNGKVTEFRQYQVTVPKAQ